MTPDYYRPKKATRYKAKKGSYARCFDCGDWYLKALIEQQRCAHCIAEIEGDEALHRMYSPTYWGHCTKCFRTYKKTGIGAHGCPSCMLEEVSK